MCLVAACSSEPATPADPCAVMAVTTGGTAELGLGTDFTPVVDGQDAELQLGLQGLLMFVVNARVRDMDIGSGSPEGAVEVVALAQDGTQASLQSGCRVRVFTALPTGELQLDSPYFLPLQPALALEGARFTIRLEIRDVEGLQATEDRAIVAHLPPTSP